MVVVERLLLVVIATLHEVRLEKYKGDVHSRYRLSKKKTKLVCISVRPQMEAVIA